TGLFQDVFVVTASDLIYDEITTHHRKAIRSVKNHESGSDRIAEAVEHMDVDIVVNVQGDEPFIDKDSLEKMSELYGADTEKNVDVVSLMRENTDENDVQNPDNVKVITDQDGFALYFTRSVIPYKRDKVVAVKYFQHIGVYAF